MYNSKNVNFAFHISTIVLAWLQKQPSHWSTFVANRVSYIIYKVGNERWRHVVSKENPADLGSRGITAHELISYKLWWNRPDWLRLPSNEWPSTSPVMETNEEKKKNHKNSLGAMF